MIDSTVYSVHPDNPDWCTFTQSGTVELLVSVLGFQKKIEKYIINLYCSRYNESRELDKKMIELYREELANRSASDTGKESDKAVTTTDNNVNLL
eukprot:gene17474-20849_t